MIMWEYKGKPFIADETIFGFTYKIAYNIDGDIYLYYGKKQIMSINEKPSLLNGKKRNGHIKFVNRNKNGKRVINELIGSQAKYHKYNGSCKDDRVKPVCIVSKEVIDVIPYVEDCKINLTYNELELLVKNDVLRRSDCLNANLLGKFYKDRIWI